MIIIFVLNILLHKINCAPSEFPNNNEFLVKEVLYGETVLLRCSSNVHNYNFEYWLFNNRKIVIGPSNYYDKLKYRYEILSGNLTVRVGIFYGFYFFKFSSSFETKVRFFVIPNGIHDIF